MSALLQYTQIAVEDLTVPAGFEREREDRIEDEKLKKSIQSSGIHHPLVVTSGSGSTYIVVEGVRRLRSARALGLTHVPCVVDIVPKDTDPDAYRDRIRFLLDHHRQNLLPSQRAKLVQQLVGIYGLGNRAVGAFLGVSERTVRNWLDVLAYPPEIIKMIDQGDIASEAPATRDYLNFNPAGRKAVAGRLVQYVQKHRRMPPSKELLTWFPPDKHGHLYRAAEKLVQRRVPGKPRKAHRRTSLRVEEQRRLVESLEMREVELKALRKENLWLNESNRLATPLARAVLGVPGLKEMATATTLESLKLFAEAHP